MGVSAVERSHTMVSSAVNRQIPVMAAVGAGSTPLAAFHSALGRTGLDRYNLVRLSSVVPPRTGVDRTGTAPAPAGAWGDKLYCVYAECRASVTGQQAWAGVGWALRADGLGGLFVEHEGDSEESVARDVQSSLHDLIAQSRHGYTTPDWVLSGAVCTGPPVCSLVIAPYEITPWDGAR